VSMVALGTFILWFGWLGFNAGSSFGANLRAVLAAWNSMICASFGGITWCLLDWRVERKYTMVGFCSGTIAGLVAATPCSGYIPVWASIVVGVVSGAACNYATKFKFLVRTDDALDLFAEHAVGGIIGLLANAFFASKDLVALDGVTSIPGGWLDHNWKQLYKQVTYICATCAYNFVMTAAICKLLDLSPGLCLRASEEAEELGMDDDQIGEFASDYVELRRNFWDPPTMSQENLDEKVNSRDSPSDDKNVAVAGDRHGIPDHSQHSHERSNGNVMNEKMTINGGQIENGEA